MSGFPWPAIAELASCICRTLEEHDRPPTCFCGVIAGDQAPLDYCGECNDDGRCGAAWVRLVSIQHEEFAVHAARIQALNNPCQAPLEATIEMGVVRCAPTLDDAGNLPTMPEQLAAAQGQVDDMNALLYAVRCCFDATDTNITIKPWTPIGPGGGCLGGSLTVTLTEV